MIRDTDYNFIQTQDEEVYKAVMGEEERQAKGLELIPSENYVSRAVREAVGSVFTNKYSEGYPFKRYYGGQMYTDVVETIAIERAKKLFNAKFVNVQPLSGAPANLAIYHALMAPGDTILGMDLSHGGHLTHGNPMTVPAKIFNFVRYKMKDPETGEIDYDALRETALREKPKVILAGFSAYSRELDYKKFVEIAREVGAVTVADMAHIAGLIAGGVARNPFDDGFDVITTTTHKTLRGPRGGMVLIRENEDIAQRVAKAVFPGLQGGPHMNNIAAKAVAFGEALHPNFKVYAGQILKNAKAMEEVFLRENVRMIGGGTSNHLLLVDAFTSFGTTGHVAETILDEVGLTLNKNMIADDTRKPFDPSGIRLGTPAMTTRNMKEKEATEVAELLVDTLRNKDDAAKKAEIHTRVEALCLAHPIPESFI
ncbi:serine hydroxymethyltransferase [Candidatus Kaiserbacteria bacterium]|nr:serine hydroxymethyltransferase [Candidatus Kaiserbacteria bacterium]